MTGYGRGEASKAGVNVSVEVRSINNRHLEVITRLPRSLAQREKDIKDIIRTLVNRGSVSISVKVEKKEDASVSLRVNKAAARNIHKLLQELRTTMKMKEEVRLEHILHFSEVLEGGEENGTDEKEWTVTEQALKRALKNLNEMRAREGKELAKDLRVRVESMNRALDTVERLGAQRVPEERKRLQERVAQLVADPRVIDQNRLELELALLAERLDVTEELVRFRSHNKMFLGALGDQEAAGRKLNFVVQEMNREANTIGSKANDASIAHVVVGIKEELEKVREQIQNIE
ncbi:MAG: YicC/YloC family endoribonuclease [Bacteroidota bacterium]